MEIYEMFREIFRESSKLYICRFYFLKNSKKEKSNSCVCFSDYLRSLEHEIEQT